MAKPMKTLELRYVIIQFLITIALIAEKWAEIWIYAEKSPRIKLTTVRAFTACYFIWLLYWGKTFILFLNQIFFRFITPFVIRTKSRGHTCQVIEKFLKPENNKGKVSLSCKEAKNATCLVCVTWVVTCN